ncbi:hypothetical protein QJS10_CPB18g01141 [Acorus calamus]|uniref:Uncharacterized protein n=1 Tax=Acorus calamus TaxID=4465 RepID=A0AAV9CKF5_ACOCL|nr:hypothetical protein QJS10_CPB18g01141 [Acorus calamus]
MSTTSSTVLRHASAFIDELLSNTDLRLRLLSSHTLPSKTTTKTLTIASQTLESAISTTTTTSLRLAEKLLLSLRSQTPQSTLLLSLIYALCHRPLDAALSLLDVFIATLTFPVRRSRRRSSKTSSCITSSRSSDGSPTVDRT